MVLVDSSVWIDYLGHRPSKVEQRLEALLRPSNSAVITGIIFQEVLQGIKGERSFQLTHELLRKLPFLVPSLESHLRAARISHSLILKGRSPSSIDTLIAALAIENKIPLFTLDKGFSMIEAHTELELF